MSFSLFTRVALKTDIPEQNLKTGDIATVVDYHEAFGKKGYTLEIFNAKGDTISVIVVDESQIEALRQDEILHVRQIEKVTG